MARDVYSYRLPLTVNQHPAPSYPDTSYHNIIVGAMRTTELASPERGAERNVTGLMTPEVTQHLSITHITTFSLYG
jgi:hypothetical protein